VKYLHVSVYFPDDSRTKEILKRVKVLEDTYDVSRGKIILKALEDYVSKDNLANKFLNKAKRGDFKTAKMVGIK